MAKHYHRASATGTSAPRTIKTGTLQMSLLLVRRITVPVSVIPTVVMMPQMRVSGTTSHAAANSSTIPMARNRPRGLKRVSQVRFKNEGMIKKSTADATRTATIKPTAICDTKPNAFFTRTGTAPPSWGTGGAASLTARLRQRTQPARSTIAVLCGKKTCDLPRMQTIDESVEEKS